MDMEDYVTLPHIHNTGLQRTSVDSDASSTTDREQVENAKRIASRIRCGQVKDDTYTKMMQRVRTQFLRPDRDHLPLVLPPCVPSVLRPNEPQVSKFSKGVKLYRRQHVAAPRPIQGHRDSVMTDVSAPGGRGVRAFSVDIDGTTRPVSATGTTRPNSPDQQRAVVVVAAPTHAVLAPLRYQIPARAFTIPESSCTRLSDISSDAPMRELQTEDEQMERFEEVERVNRAYITTTEAWDREVAYEMMLVHYVTFVLKPELEDVLSDERFDRGALALDEEHERFRLCNDPLAETIKEYERAVRAKEAKLARLDRVNQLYPTSKETTGNGVMHPAPPARSATAPAAAGGSSNAGGDQEARFILQNYVRQRHAATVKAIESSATSQRRESVESAFSKTTPFEGGSFVARRKTIGVAQLIKLLDEDDTYRSLIIESEATQRRDILQLAQEERNAVRGWQHKRMHMERLLYWREEREKKMQSEVTAMIEGGDGIIVDDELLKRMEFWGTQEDTTRGEIAEEEGEDRRDLRDAYRVLSHRLEAAQCEAEFCSGLHRMWQEMTAEKLSVLADMEAVARAKLESDFSVLSTDRFESDWARLCFLQSVSDHPLAPASVVTLQRAFRLSEAGRLGWRATHKDIGREIHSQRDEKKINRGRNGLSDFRQKLEEERVALIAEIKGDMIKKQHRLMAEETAERNKTVELEDWLYGSQCAQLGHEIIYDYIIPEMKRCMVREEAGRTLLTSDEAEQRHTIVHCTAELAQVLRDKSVLRVEEAHLRSQIEASHHEEFKTFVYEEFDHREAISLRDAERAEMHRAERAAFARQATVEIEAAQYECLLEHTLWHQENQRRLLMLQATDPSMIAKRLMWEEVERRSLFVAHVHAQLAILRQQAREEVRKAQIMYVVGGCLISEDLDRTCILGEEVKARRELDAKIEVAYEDGYLITKESQARASNTIKDAYRRSKSGELGRTATRNYLNEAFRPKRENMALQAARARNLEDIRRAERQLAFHIDEERRVAREKSDMTIGILTEKAEPRGRTSIEEEQEMIYTIIMRNFIYEGRIRGLDPESVIALFIETEAYERVQVMKGWRQRFTEEFEPTKVNFKKDVYVRRIQRGWRCHAARERRRELIAEAIELCLCTETQNRAAYELEEHLAWCFDISKPGMQAGHDIERLYDIAKPTLESGMRSCRAAIMYDESRGVSDLLWDRAYEECEQFLCAEERAAREQLVESYYVPGEERVLFMEEETAEREALETERVLYLARIIIREEAACRDGILVQSCLSDQQQLLFNTEETGRIEIVDNYTNWWRAQVFEPLHKAMIEMVFLPELNGVVGQVGILRVEDATRLALMAEAPKAIAQLCQDQEYEQRTIAYMASVFERQHEGLFIDEAAERTQILTEWDLGVGYVPSSFAPTAINMRSSVYTFCAEGLEECVRECVAADWISGWSALLEEMNRAPEEEEQQQQDGEEGASHAAEGDPSPAGQSQEVDPSAADGEDGAAEL